MSVHALYGRDREQVTCIMECWGIAEEESGLVAEIPLAETFFCGYAWLWDCVGVFPW